MVPCPSGSAGRLTGRGRLDRLGFRAAGYLVGPTGLALYEYDKDTTANSSACTGDCATNWPALTVATGQSAVAGSGVDQEDFAVFTRAR